MARGERRVCVWLSWMAGFRGVTDLKCWAKENILKGRYQKRKGECLEINGSVLDKNIVVLFLMYSCLVMMNFYFIGQKIILLWREIWKKVNVNLKPSTT